ncbi:OLC1v1006704C1 [Oldenlandia corymbosa var. corymbosa]|uniref:OLC1v1006704C1 n=1 Tax=Oldenlandia corymbosa var. corymbosa TaxID=529605 RepID=A0AAV1DL12_OLDCO|nr:OLC1v1006704C1 [Oldenlandia corymbosa var. corymbosa]
MAKMSSSFWHSLTLFAICVCTLGGSISVANEERKVYIVYMGALPSNPNYSPETHHLSLLQQVTGSSFNRESLIRSYTRSLNGFAARLTEKEAAKLSRDEAVVSIFPNKIFHIRTTRSWDFIGFPQNVQRNLNGEGEVIIGILDTGIWPENPSFKDDGFGPIPKKWKGECKGGPNFTCNKKIIGARTYPEESCRDTEGHGSHTASTAAGNVVKNTSFYGIAGGVARGGAPSARIAAYKVCSEIGCSEMDIMAAFDDAIADGVDILSLSLGPDYPLSLDIDGVAIGGFHAAEKGILTLQAAGNGGPEPGQTPSVAPWLFGVAASTTDRKIFTKVVLGNGKILEGYSVNSFKLNGTQFPVVYGAVAPGCEVESARSCQKNCLDPKLVKGKIILCDDPFADHYAYEVGAIGFISPGRTLNVSSVSPYASVILDSQVFDLATSYYKSTKNPTMNILKSGEVKNLDTPIVATFSSRGPNAIIPDILKPDIIAPGVEILAAFSLETPPSDPNDSDIDKRRVSYSILSGTSMSCPHVTGAAAYVKSMHLDWSASAIKSALMTTADASRMKISVSKYGDNEFSYGAGHLNPIKAANPGIVYETTKEEYHKLLCSMNLGSGFNISCNDYKPGSFEAKDLNYPSMAATIESNNVGKFKFEFKRRAKNVGAAKSIYQAKTNCYQSGCKVTVVPKRLEFKALNEEIPFVITISGENIERVLSASLEWNDGIHVARSPIVVYKPQIVSS